MEAKITQNTITTASGEEVKSIKDIKAKKKQANGKIARDSFPKEEVRITTSFPEIIKDTVYAAKKVHGFPMADKNSFLRNHQEKLVGRVLRETYAKEMQEYIFSDFDGTILEFISHMTGTPQDDIIEKCRVRERLTAIPNAIKTISAGV